MSAASRYGIEERRQTQLNLFELENYFIDYDVRDELKKLVYDRSFAAFAQGDRDRDAIASREELEARRESLREKLIEAIGGLPSGDAPLHPRTTGVVVREGYVIEKVMFESRPRAYVTANLYVPDGIASPRGAVLFLCGHDREAKHGEEYQTVCGILVQAGLVVLAMDPIGQGERFSYFDASSGSLAVDDGIVEHDYAGQQCLPLGDGLARYFLHDAMRAIDYLAGRPEVDPARIGVTGNSGGGTQTSLMMLADPRIAAAAPATFIMSRESYLVTGQAQDAEQIWFGMTALGLDHEDILMAMAPKPVLVLAVTNDFFPIEGTHRTVERVRRFWTMYGCEDRLRFVEDDSHHKYTAALAQAAAGFFREHLLAGKGRQLVGDADMIDPQRLWCTVSGQVRGDIPDARGVHEETVDRLRALEQAREALPAKDRRADALAWLKERVWTARRESPLYPRVTELGRWNGLRVRSVVWWSQAALHGHAFLFGDTGRAGEDGPVTIALWEKGTRELQRHAPTIRKICDGGRQLMVLDVSGSGALMPNAINRYDLYAFYGTVHKLATDLFWLGDSLAAMRVYDVIRALDAAEALSRANKGDIQIYTTGRFSLYAHLANALDSRIASVEAVSGTTDFSSWVKSRYYDEYNHIGFIMPGMLRHFDLQDL